MRWDRKTIAALLAVAILQSGVLGYMVADRVRLLSTGREIVLPIVPVDPRDLFRGEYVQLSYEISALKPSLLEGPPPAPNARFYVTLQRGQNDTWAPVKISAAPSSEGASDRIVLAARPRSGGAFPTWGALAVWANYGIESYFVPEGKGRELERLARDRKLAAVVAVDPKGNAAIKGLLADGHRVYSEPLF